MGLDVGCMDQLIFESEGGLWVDGCGWAQMGPLVDGAGLVHMGPPAIGQQVEELVRSERALQVHKGPIVD